MIKHPTDRAERLRVNEKKTKEKRKSSKFKRRIKETVAEQETEDELRAYVRAVDPDRNGEELDRNLAPNTEVH